MGRPDCPVCGAPATGELHGSTCAACLVALALAAADDSADGSEAVEYAVLTVLSSAPGRSLRLARRAGSQSLVTFETIDLAALGLGGEAVEARLARLRALSHPLIARVLDAWITPDGECCVVSEYVAGQALGPGQALEREAALDLFDAVCDAVARAHAQGAAHGALGPDCIRLTGTSDSLRPRLTGFTVSAPQPAVEDDVAGLERVLAHLAGHVSMPADVAEIVREAAGSRRERRHPDVAALRAAVAAARQKR